MNIGARCTCQIEKEYEHVCRCDMAIGVNEKNAAVKSPTSLRIQLSFFMYQVLPDGLIIGPSSLNAWTFSLDIDHGPREIMGLLLANGCTTIDFDPSIEAPGQSMTIDQVTRLFVRYASKKYSINHLLPRQ